MKTNNEIMEMVIENINIDAEIHETKSYSALKVAGKKCLKVFSRRGNLFLEPAVGNKTSYSVDTIPALASVIENVINGIDSDIPASTATKVKKAKKAVTKKPKKVIPRVKTDSKSVGDSVSTMENGKLIPTFDYVTAKEQRKESNIVDMELEMKLRRYELRLSDIKRDEIKKNIAATDCDGFLEV